VARGSQESRDMELGASRANVVGRQRGPSDVLENLHAQYCGMDGVAGPTSTAVHAKTFHAQSSQWLVVYTTD
jgi:hypothetical protein